MRCKKMSKFRPALFLFGLLGFGGMGTAQSLDSTLLMCSSSLSEEIYIELFKSSKFGEPLHCVSAPYLIDLTPCSPDNGWGLSRGTGMTELIEITSSWKRAHEHFYGKFRATIRPKYFAAAAAFGEGLPNFEGLDESTFWIMEVNRENGSGYIMGKEFLEKDGEYVESEIVLEIQCSLVERSF